MLTGWRLGAPLALGALLGMTVAGPVAAASDETRKPRDPAAIERLKSETGAEVTLSGATGAARFVRAGRGKALGLAGNEDKADHAMSFLERHGRAFGLRDPRAELKLESVAGDRIGGSHLTYSQRHDGVPVFGASVKAHYDAQGRLTVVNGSLVPDLSVNVTPSRSGEEAGAAALAEVSGEGVAVRGSALLIFREGLAKGVPGDDHLAYEVEVGNGADVREFVYVDAHTGKVIDRITGIHDALFRRAYDAQGQTAPGPNYPASPYWVEGDPFPTNSTEPDNMIFASKETYDVYSKGFGRDSFDAAGAIMDSIFNRGNGCPNASWNGQFISFCPGTTSDDVTAHEWSHAYTQYTHNLIYQWQPGALNEAYSDMFGEVVDLTNGRQSDSPGGPRTAGSCSTFSPLPPAVIINAPPAIAGSMIPGTAAFGPQSFNVTNDVVLADDGVSTVGTTSDGCCAGPSFVCAANSWPNAAAVAGKIAVVDRGTCGFAIKVKNAQVNGAIGVIVANNVAGTINMAGVDPTITIPALLVSLADGNTIKGQLGSSTVNATLRRGGNGTDNSYRWLMGEDATAFGAALRDLWNPNCANDPGKVSDRAYYVCSTGDGGGVHTNSGIPNHAFALVVDGGTYNGQTVVGLGLTKAAHIYFRAASVYQGPATDFAEHADALEQSCSDLVGVNLNDLATGTPSGQIISSADCDQVAAAAAAVELRTPPTFCNFQPLLAQNPPPLCSTGNASRIFRDTFEAGDSWMDRWQVSHTAVTADFTPRDWAVVGDLPDARPGRAFFGPNPDIGTCAPGGDESGVLHLVSKPITIPGSVTAPKLTFDHWIATEPGFDGGNLKISVNGGPWQTVAAADFVYNAYNLTLAAAPGNTNPMAGQPAFSGTDGGKVDGSWGRSIVNLAPYAPPDSSIQLRFDLGSDGCTGRFGWYLDDLMVYVCRGK
jgi:Zn-dependent metalloprotease